MSTLAKSKSCQEQCRQLGNPPHSNVGLGVKLIMWQVPQVAGILRTCSLFYKLYYRFKAYVFLQGFKVICDHFPLIFVHSTHL